MQTEPFECLVDGKTLRGVYHLPDQSGDKPAVVLMGHGYGTEWQFGTAGFIKAFTDAGLATVNFDYRYFGKSDGEPRQLVDIKKQLEDWRAVLKVIQKSALVDSGRIALWGSSLGGGHAISIAAETPDLKALVAQVPHCCSNAAFKTVKLTAVFRGVFSAIYDQLRAAFGLSVFKIPILGEPDEYAVLNHPGWKRQYLALKDEISEWENKIPARSLLRSGEYRPILLAEKVTCPALIIYGKSDEGVPAESVEQTAAKMGDVVLHSYDGGHFEVYSGKIHSDTVRRETEFLVSHLNK